MFWRFQVGGWTAFTAVYVAATAQVLPLGHALLDKAAFGTTGFLVSLALWPLCRRARASSLVTALILVGGGCYVGGLAWSMLYNSALYGVGLAPDLPSWPRVGGSLNGSGTLLAWAASYFGLVYARELERREADLAHARERALSAQSQARGAQLRALRYQLDPHFLFNTLNAISTLIEEQRPAAAQTTVLRLADFLRATLDDRDAIEVTLARELELVDRYLAIERARLHDRLDVHIQVSEDVLAAGVPALLLQPLVENAIRHGVARREAGGQLSIRAHGGGDRLRILVADTPHGPLPARAAEAPALGLGLANTRARLTALFDDDFGLALEASDRRTEVRIDLPLRGVPVGEMAG
jgi:two-component system LytT family sensor kinase